MSDQNKPRAQLIEELEELRQRVAALEHREAERCSEEERFGMLFEYAPDACYLNDLRGVFVDGNRAAEEIIGYDRNELIGQSFLQLDLLSTKQMPRAASNLARNALGLPTGPDEFVLNRKDGSQIPVEIRTFPVKIEDQRLVLGIARDISERKEAERALQSAHDRLKQRVEERTAELQQANESLEREIRERRQTEQALRESEERYRSIFQGVSNGIVLLSIEGTILEVNDQAVQIYGGTRDELIGKRFTKVGLFSKTIVSQLLNSFRLVLSQETFTIEFSFINKQNKEIHLECSTTHINEDGKIARLVVVLRDITRRKQAQQRLQMLGMAVEQSIDGIAVADVQGIIQYANPAWAQMHGYQPEGLVGQNLSIFHTPAQLQDDVVPFNEIVRQTGSNQGEVGHVTQDGTTFPTQMTTSLLTDSSGIPTGLVGIARDITKQKKAEAQLTEEKAFSESLVNGLPGMFYLVDANGKYIRWNRNLETITGYSASEVAQRHPLEYFEDGEKLFVAGKIQEAFEQGTAELEATIVTRNGEKIPFFFSGFRIMIDGEPHLLGVGIDISERKRAEELLRVQHRLGLSLLAARGLDETLQVCLETAIQTSGMNGGGIYLFDEAAGFDLVCHMGLPPDSIEALKHYNLDSPNTQLVLAGEPIYLDAEQVQQPAIGALVETDARSLAIIPVYSEGHIIACLNLVSYNLDRVPEYVRHTVEAIAAQIGTAINHSQMEQALKESEKRLAFAIEASEAGYYIQTADFSQMYVNERWVEHLGYTLDDIPSSGPERARMFAETVHPDDFVGSTQKFADFINNRAERYRAEFRTLHKDGSWHWLNSMATAIERDEEGKVVRLAGVFFDITEQKEAAAALQKAHDELETRVEERTKELQASEARWRSLVANAPDLIIIVDVDGTILSVNRTVTGRPLEEVIGTSIYSYIPPEYHSVARRVHEGVFLTGESGRYETLGVGANDTQAWYVTRVGPIKQDGGIVALVLVSSDITESKQAEAQIRASLGEKETLLKEIHHRVKNNLQVVASLLNMQSRYTHDEQAVQDIIESRDRVYSMALAHENLYRSGDLARVDMATYISDVVSNVFQSYGTETSQFLPKLELEQLSLTIDQAVPCGLIVSELVSNAAKHAFIGVPERSKGEVTVSLQTGVDNKVTLSVADNGVGLPPDLDLDASKTLGLRLIRSLAQQLEATLEVECTPCTTFRVSFRKMDDLAEKEEPEGTQEPEGEGNRRGR